MSAPVPLLSGLFRANDAYELLPFDQLAAEDRELLEDLCSDPSFYGVLRPRSPSRLQSAKSVDRDAALLFLTLAKPAALPEYVRRAFGAGTERAVTKLVADGVLEVDLGAGFISGAEALAITASPGAGNYGRLAALSRDALRYAQELPIDDTITLAARIYGYNRLPLTPRWQHALPNAAAHARYIGISGGAVATTLARSWSALAPSSYWLFWEATSRGCRVTGGASHKLYVSPLPEALSGDGFATIAAALSAARALGFKVGAGAGGLLRPDKIVAYFPNFEMLAEGAARVRERLDGMPAHGVPFTAEAGGDGLLSWGEDPPRRDALAWIGAQSWRLWVARRLARAIISGRAATREQGASSAKPCEPWLFALERLRLEGINTQTWAPEAAVFAEA